ncbi:MAG: histidine kinase [Flavobacteriales bacterium]|nr:histidine kinase [Flavobacteriales bacterium]
MQTENEHIDLSLLNSFKAFIGSHFLLNVINSIQSDIILSDKKSAFDTLQIFNRIYKNALRFSNAEFAELNAEISFLNDYISLENIRFAPRTFSKLSTFQTESGEVPVFVFQSFIENAILLSLENKSTKPKFVLLSKNDFIEFSITLAETPEKNIHPKIESKLHLALERLDILKAHRLLEYEIAWNEKYFMQLKLKKRKD